jgi:branched-chain amino acid transport system substrate-binding protein
VHRRMKAMIVLIAAAPVLALAACSPSGTSAASAGPASAAAQLKGAPIVIGSICSCSGSEAASIGGVSQTLQAWQDYTNANGGINGHPVKLIVLDDGGNATTSARDARELVEQDHVVAIVSEMSLNDGTWASYVASTGVPVIGAANYNATFLTNPDFFSTGTQTPTLVYGVLQQAKLAGVTKVGVLPCAEAPACAGFAALFQAIGPKVVGVQVPYVAKITTTQPSYTATCLAARSAGSGALVVIENSPTVLRVADQCAQQGYKPIQLNLSGTAGQDWPGDPNLNGAIAIESNPVLADQTIPAMQAFHRALSTYAPGLLTSTIYNELDSQAWAGAQVFALAAKRANLSPISTSADLKKGLYTFKSETVGGLTPPLTYVAGKPALTTCYFVTKVSDSEFTVPQGATATCVPATQVPTLLSALQP